MSVLKNRLQTIRSERNSIIERVAKEDIRPSASENEIVQRIARDVAERFRDEIAASGINAELKQRIIEVISDESAQVDVDYEQQKRIERIAIAYVVGLGPIEAYQEDPTVSEIIVQRFDNICIEVGGVIHSVDAAFTDEAHLQTVINRIVQPVGRQINISSPMVNARLPDGSRVNATIPPISPDGATLTIRKFPEKALTGEDYLKLNSISASMLQFLEHCVKGRISIMVSGGTGAGKTTALNVLSSFVPKEELIITIEDTCELRLQQPNVRRMEARATSGEGMMAVDTQALVKNSLRMRPDRIIVGEIRDGTIVDMMSAMSTGHEGSLSTVHANNPTNLVNSRIPILYSMNNSVQFSPESQNMQIAEALMLIVHIARMRDGSRKFTHITHVVGLGEDGKIQLSDIFAYNESKKQFEATGYVPDSIITHAKAHGVNIDPSLFKKEPQND